MKVELPPDPITDLSDLTLRCAVGDADGLRSTTWSVVLQKNSGGVFIGARSQMGDTKLILHRSGTWRLAFTEQSGRQTETGDRVIARGSVAIRVSGGSLQWAPRADVS